MTPTTHKDEKMSETTPYDDFADTWKSEFKAPGPETETLDRLYLEWSQFTKARTAKEIALCDALADLLKASDPLFSRDDGFFIAAREKARNARARARGEPLEGK